MYITKTAMFRLISCFVLDNLKEHPIRNQLNMFYMIIMEFHFLCFKSSAEELYSVSITQGLTGKGAGTFNIRKI